jgi:bifunctional UDP-N-acetylglucosamine pyrophosphorylase/glucosamine-1-phosphate N-acetyltransferase
MAEPPLVAVVLAAGEGTRMRSARPKPLHLLCGRAMLLHILDGLAAVPVDSAVVVVGHGAEAVTKKLEAEGPEDLGLRFAEQRVQRGTGDAAMVALTAFQDDDLDGDVLVVPGDTPLLRATTLADLVAAHRDTDAAATLLTAVVPEPRGYGRVVRRADGRVQRIVEEVDATDDERALTEINTSVYCFRRSLLAPALRRLSPENRSGEYYLTDVVQVLSDAGHPVAAVAAPDAREVVGVNDRVQLAAAEAELRARTNDAWMRRGVTMVDPLRVSIDTGVELGPDVTLFPGVVLQGRTVIGPGVELGPGTRLVDCVVEEGATLTETVGTDATVGAGAQVGPFAVLGPGEHVAAGARVGPFYTRNG